MAWFIFIGVLAVGSRWQLQRGQSDRCSLDGNRISNVYRVDLMLRGQVAQKFCCIKCAVEWPDVPGGAAWQVHDEVTGRPIDATRARFVKSDVITVASRQGRTHAFANWTDAVAHIKDYNGKAVPNPFGGGAGHADDND